MLEYIGKKLRIFSVLTACLAFTACPPVPGPEPVHTHNYGTAWTYNATQHYKQCSCGDKIDVANHTVSDWKVDLAATTTTVGSKHKECTVCRYETATETIPVIGSHTHVWGAWTQTKAPTETQDGEETRTCTLDPSHKETRPVAALNHTHVWGAWTQTIAPTCTTAGVETRTCSLNQSHIETRPGASALGHDWGAWGVTIAPTATEGGVDTRTCKRDVSHKETRNTPATGEPGHIHDWGEYKVTTAATCQTAGEEERTCKTDATHKETQPIEALGHNYGNWTQTTAPTCTTDGVETRTCTRDPSHIETRPVAIDPDAHDWNTYYTTTTAATEIENGTEAITCKHNPSHTKEPRIQYATGTAGLYYSYDYSGGGTYRVFISTATTATTIHIPAYYRPDARSAYLPITEISGSAYYSGSDFTTSIIFAAESPLTTIGSYACYGCTSLASITIPNSVTSIGSYAFQGCTSLTGITIPDNVTSIGSYAFQDCTSLTGITIPDSVTSIGSNAFDGCWSLASITVDANNPNYASEDGILYNKAKTAIVAVPQGISGNVTLPASVTSISSNVFSRCRNLTSITVDANNPNYASNDGILYNKAMTTLLQAPGGIGNVTTIPNSVTSIGQEAFSGCTGLTSVTIPDSVTSIGYRAFQGCTGLTSITFPDNSVTTMSISSRAFANCTGLTSITIPNSVRSIGSSGDTDGDGVFYGCTNLTSIIIDNNRITFSSYTYSYLNWGIIFPADNLSVIFKKNIGNYAFNNCARLTSVTIDESVTSIGQSAFSSCTSLTSVTIPASVTSIDSLAFSNTAWFNNQPDGLVYAGKVLYTYKGTMPANTIINNIRTDTVVIGTNAFYNCTGLTSVTIPNSVTFIDNLAFAGCTSLTSVNCLPTTPPLLEFGVFQSTHANLAIKVPSASVNAYKSATNWSTYSSRISPM
jgi:hypothetical protein